MEPEASKKLEKIERILEDLAAATARNFRTIEEKLETEFEGLNGKMEGVHRRIDAELERHAALESRVTKLEDSAAFD
jgi:hypothetical protein